MEIALVALSAVVVVLAVVCEMQRRTVAELSGVVRSEAASFRSTIAGQMKPVASALELCERVVTVLSENERQFREALMAREDEQIERIRVERRLEESALVGPSGRYGPGMITEPERMPMPMSSAGDMDGV